MPFIKSDAFDLVRLTKSIDSLPLAITILDPKGRMLYYNEYSTRFLDRRPEYLGEDIRNCHRQDSSRAKIDRMLGDFADGRREPFTYRIERSAKRYRVILSPVEEEGSFSMCIQTVVPDEP